MKSRLFVHSLVLPALMFLSACAGGQSNDLPPLTNAAVPVEMISSAGADMSAASAAFLDPEFACGGSGHNEYVLGITHSGN